MIGAIIGDLAAWTWENNHEKFYPSLISEKALLFEFENTSKKRKYFQGPMKVLGLAVESTFDDHRKYLRFFWVFSS